MRDCVSVFALAVLCCVLAGLPPVASVAHDDRCLHRAKVTAIDDSELKKVGMVEYGTQHLTVEMLTGPGKGNRFPGENEVRAQLDIDKKFAVGDVVTVSWPGNGPKCGEALLACDYYRLRWGGVLLGGFVVSLLAFGGWTGLKSLFSFVFSCFAIWKLLVPLCLKGWDASLISFVTVSVLTAVIMWLVAGMTRKGLAAFLGAILGVSASLGLARFFTAVMHVNGATMPFAQALLNAGYVNLSLPDIFLGSVILASSGAVMDLAMDIAVAIEEVSRHSPSLGRRALLSSGFRVGRSVVGTMTTTLLLAYSGGYLTLLMVFAAQGTHPIDFLNSTLVSAEVVKTLVGSFGLVLVAPFTAVVSAIVFGGGIKASGTCGSLSGRCGWFCDISSVGYASGCGVTEDGVAR